MPESGSSRQLTITGALTNSSAFEQTLVADGASGPGNSGVLTIASSSLTGAFALIVRGPTGAGPNGGVIEFPGSADATAVRVITEPGTYFDFSARAVALRIASLAGGATVLMGGNSLTVGFDGSSTEFSGVLAGGATARLEKVGAGTLILSESNTYGNGTTISGGTVEVRAPAYGLSLGPVTIKAGGSLVFSGNARANFATHTAEPSVGNPGFYGTISFRENASADRATLVARHAVIATGLGGSIQFSDTSSGGTSAITNEGGTSDNSGFTGFRESSTAGAATIVNGGALAGIDGGKTFFGEDATAGTALIRNDGGRARSPSRA